MLDCFNYKVEQVTINLYNSKFMQNLTNSLMSANPYLRIFQLEIFFMMILDHVMQFTKWLPDEYGIFLHTMFNILI